MGRIERSEEKFKQLLGEEVSSIHDTDPDFEDILTRFIFGEVFCQGNLTDKMRELITLVVLATSQTLPQLRAHVSAALNVGVTPLIAVITHCLPYIGFPRTLNALACVNEIIPEN